MSAAGRTVGRVSNKVRKVEPERRPDAAVDGPALYFRSAGSAAIRDESQALRSRRETMTICDHGVYGPFGSAEEAAGWWAANRHDLPEPPRARLLSDDWQRGRPEVD
ncbi:hypothetical protein DZF92_04570 [Clavibacter michiganensis subsp. insidiosus]|uniref:Uncharacterized protein n=1 Tax=Clavibacter michiganensis subsp. insidiosus TaxID=33014 RepID=A0A0D5CGJ2_9MICO|nr:hypothetical protein VO01_05930 [Clavibacter michiganensis subsp. insidiosus]AWG01179.1 hypothetical protein BEH62_06165 [Clavibacter michiganensis subsp. insidiosus]RII88042.1 hypothetical protein DZF92_04570 [Clavibacter michiganensis subsp. insidiosus]RIJ29931.1 hypothetical protein DZF93_09925 [Clavibacter michiganensis subsp. insidiosus]RMC85593.1 hypothetical protein CmiCFBP2404_07225 [Clavibacter michiganensis subsp. insidiosus]